MLVYSKQYNYITLLPPASPSLTFIRLFAIVHRSGNCLPAHVSVFLCSSLCVLLCTQIEDEGLGNRPRSSFLGGVGVKDPSNKALLLSSLMSADMSGDGSGDFGRERGSGEGVVDGTMVDDEDFVSPKLRRKWRMLTPLYKLPHLHMAA